MAVSTSALLTLIALVFAGPLFYACRYVYRRFYPVPAVVGKEEDDGHGDSEIVPSSSYMLGLLGYAIGIGNVWRFPYLVGQYGGGAFVFAYVVCLFLIAMPLYFVELGLGQHTRAGAIATLNSKSGIVLCGINNFIVSDLFLITCTPFCCCSDQASMAVPWLGTNWHGVNYSSVLQHPSRL